MTFQYRSAGIPRLLVLLIGVALTACGRSEPAAEPEAAPQAPATEVTMSADQITHGGIKWSPAALSTVTETVELPGELKVDDDRTVRVSAPTRGRLLTIRGNVGDRVSRGQVIATLQSEEATAARAEFSKASAELANRQAALEFAQAARERAERLLALKAISQQDVERARTEEKSAAAAVAQAQAESDRSRTALAVLDVDPATGQILLKPTRSGVVLSRDAMAGAVVDAGATIVVVTDPDSLWLEVAVPDRLSTSIQAGARLRFAVSAVPGKQFDARVHRLAASVDPATRTVLVRAVVTNRQRQLRPAMLATVRLETGAPQTGVAIPDEAIQMIDERSVVFIAGPDGKGGARFLRRDVEVVAKGEDRRRIVRGVKEGELIVTEGAFALKAEFGRARIRIG